jgi:vesicle-fusing ATPase
LKVLIGKQPPKDRRLLIFATTTARSVLQQLDLFSRFDYEIPVPNVGTQAELAHILQHSGVFSEQDQNRAIREIEETTGTRDIQVGVKTILTTIETAKEDSDMPGRFARALTRSIAANRSEYA